MNKHRKSIFWVRNDLVAQFSCYSRSYAHDHSSLKIRNPPVGFRSNPSSIFISPARSNVFRLFKQKSVSKDEKKKEKRAFDFADLRQEARKQTMTSKGKRMKQKIMIYKLL